METQPEIEKKNDMGRPSFGEQGPQLYFQQGLLYPKLHIEDNKGCEIMQSQQSLILIETRVSFLQTYRIQMVQVIYIIFWPEGLLTLYDSDKSLSTIKLIFSKSNYFKVWRHLPKINCIPIGWMCNGFKTKERIYYLKGLKLLARRPLLIFSTYQLY